MQLSTPRFYHNSVSAWCCMVSGKSLYIYLISLQLLLYFSVSLANRDAERGGKGRDSEAKKGSYELVIAITSKYHIKVVIRPRSFHLPPAP